VTRCLPVAIVGLVLAAAQPLVAQEHGSAHPEPVKVAPSIVPPIVVHPGAAKAKPVESGKHVGNAKPVESGKHVDNTKPVEKAPKALPPAKVAAAVAEALKEAEAAAARRSAHTPVVIRVRRSASTSASTSAAKKQHYAVRWPSQRMVVRWPEPAGDRVKLSWPEQAPATDLLF
jgi:hypothetical protein